MPRLWCWTELIRCLQLPLLSSSACSAVQHKPIRAAGLVSARLHLRSQASASSETETGLVAESS